jgi:hypothetical protein
MAKVLGGIAGAVVGFVLGGPVGALVGATIGYTAVDALTNKNSVAYTYTESGSPTYSFGKLQTQVSNLMPRQMIYGELKVAGNKIWQNGENTSTIRQIVIFGEGEIEEISDVRLNDYEISTLAGCSYNAYYGTGVQEIDTRVSGANHDARALKVGGLRYDAYIAITAQASSKISNSGFNVTAIIKGRKVRVYTTPTTYTVEYSNNPAWCILDFLTAYNGMGLSHSSMNISTFISAANYCSAQVDGQDRFNLNLILDTRKSRLDWLNTMLLICRGYILYLDGEVQLKIDQAGNSVQSFDSSNIINGSESFWTTPRENWYDIVKVQFIDPLNEYAKVYAIAESAVYKNEQPIVKSVEAYGVTNFKQASRLAWFYLNEAALTNKFMAFTTTKAGLDRTIGDIIEITSPTMGYSNKKFRIISLDEAQEGQIKITCKEYNADLYGDTQGSIAPTYDVISKDNSFDTTIQDITLSGSKEEDQVRLLQNLIDDLSAATGGVLNVDAEEDGVLLNGAISVKSNVHLVFKCPVFLGQYGQIRIFGGFYESPDSNLPKIGLDRSVGDTRIYMGAQAESHASNFNVDDKIIIRGMSDGNGVAIEYQECTITNVDGISNFIDVAEPLEYAFKISYPAGDYEANFGNTDYTFITKMTYASFTSDANRGDYSISVDSTTGFAAGDYVFFGDDKTPSDIAGSSNNTYRHEVNRILSIDGTTINFENALCHDYETTYDAYIIKMDMVENASVRGAIVNYTAEPFDFITNAFWIAYAKDCWIENCVVENEGNYTSKGHGFRIDRAINCHTYNCAIYPPQHIDAAEGYGFTFYRSNHCSHNNSYARGCRHSFLSFRGASHNRFNNITSVNCRKSDIDFHGGDEYGNVVDGFTIIGGDQIYGTHIEAIKFGNESHVAGAFNNVVKNGIVLDYKGYGVSFVPESSNNIVENVTFRNIDRFIRHVDLSADGTLKARNNIIKNCLLDTIKTDLGYIDSTVNGGSSQIIDGLIIENCIFKNIDTYFKNFTNTINCKILNNKFFDGVENASDPWFIKAINSDNLLISDNIIEKGTRFVYIENCDDFVCKDNKLKDFYDTVILDDYSGNGGYKFDYNDCEGFNETYTNTGGGSENGRIINKHQANMETIQSNKTFPLNCTTILPIDNTTPAITEGDEILNYIYTPKNTKSKVKIEVYVPSVYTNKIIPAGLALFKDSNCIAVNSSRIPTSGQSNAMPFYVMAILDLDSKDSFIISARMGPNASATITLGGRFNGLAAPILVIQELSPNPESNRIFLEDLSGFLLLEDGGYLLKE